MFCRNGSGNDKSFNMGHPKLAKLEEVVLDHFRSKEGKTKVRKLEIVFEYMKIPGIEVFCSSTIVVYLQRATVGKMG